MKRFKYRLEKVLDYRTSEKKERERELAGKNFELRRREAHLDDIVTTQNAGKGVSEGEMTMAEVELQGRYSEYLQQALVHQRLLIIEATEAVERARDAYLEKAVETEILETLKERRQDEFKEERRKAEKKELDELVVQRHKTGRTGGSGGNHGE